MTETSEAAATPEPAAEGMSLFGRAIAVFVRPADAWKGLDRQVQWWFPTLVFLGVMAAVILLLHDRALMPMMMDTFDRQIADGTMPAAQAAKIEQFLGGPAGKALIVGQQTLVLICVLLLQALAISFTAGFLMGGKLRYRLALEVSAWSSLVTIPGQLLFFALAWFRETMEGIHIGFGAFVPEPETPSKLIRGLTTFLDFLGPFPIWALVVSILGAAALSGLPRRSVARTLSIVQVVLWLLFAVLGALFARGA